MQKRYQTDKNADGTVNVRGVEAFKLCDRGGKHYRQDWYQRAKSAFDAEKSQGHLPALAIGHKESPTAEQPRIGDLDNLRISGDTVLVDLVNIPAADFEASVKSRKYPARSVELHPRTGKIQALSLLGKTPPFHKMPLLAFAEGDDAETLYFEEKDGGLVPADLGLDGELSLLGQLVQRVKSWVVPADKKGLVKTALSNGLSAFQEEINKFSEEEKMTDQEKAALFAEFKKDMQAEMDKSFEEKFAAKYAEKFEEDFGQKPEEFKLSQEAARKAGFTTKVTAFAEEAKKVIAPAIVDGHMLPLVEALGQPEEPVAITFAEKETGDPMALLAGMVGAIKEAANTGSLLVNFDETSKKGGDDENSNFQNVDGEAELVKKVEKFQAKEGIETFEEAFDLYQAETEK